MSKAELDCHFHHAATRGYHYVVMLLYTQFKKGGPTENMVRYLSLQWDLMYDMRTMYVALVSPVDEGMHTTSDFIETGVEMVLFFQ
jgi:hypothetical protein